MSRTLNLSASDLDALARIVQAEAGGQSPQGQLAVMFTILNRAAAKGGGFADSVIGVIEQPNQFEPMTGKKSVFDLPLPSPEISSLVTTAAAGIASGQLPDPTGRATFFQNVDITNRRGTNFAAAEPTARIGDHSFYNRYRLNAPVEVPDYTVSLEGEGAPSAPTRSVGDGVVVGGDASSSGAQEAPAAPSYSSAFAAAASGSKALGHTPFASSSSFVAGYQKAKAEQTPSSPPTQHEATSSPASNPFMSALSSNPSTQGAYSLKPTHDGVSLEGIQPAVLDAGRVAANYFGSDLSINSGFRTQAHQDRIRASGDPNRPTVAKHSHHTSGTGLDISTAGLSKEDRVRLVEALADAGFVGFGNYDTHIHADMRGSVPSTFGKRDSWLGWTNAPPEMVRALKSRGFAPGMSADELRRLRGLS